MIRFGHGKESAGSSRRTWESKCGRFLITRWEFDLPIRSTEYRLTDQSTGRVYKDCGLLADAKQFANDIEAER